MSVNLDCNRGRIESILYIHTFIANVNDDDEDILEIEDDDDIQITRILLDKYHHYSNHDISMRFT